MTKAELNALKYPTGKFENPGTITKESIDQYIGEIETFPARLKKAVKHLTAEQLDTRYRPGGWTVRQLVHHMGHSHMNALIRLKLALTEYNPKIKPYDENKWVRLADTIHADIAPSLQLIETLHASWVIMLKAMKPRDFSRTYLHPADNAVYTLALSTAVYAWHSNHHLSHITELKKRNGWK